MTESNQLPAFDGLCDQLLPLGALKSPSELHGYLCGKLCGGMRMTESAWLNAVWNFLDLVGESVEESLQGDVRMSVCQLYRASLEQLEDDGYGLTLLLPDDDADLDQRIAALGQWCGGFLSGFGSAEIAPDQQLSASATEAIRDFAAIVQVGIGEENEEEETDDELERHYMEIVEYVRMATLTLLMEMGNSAKDDATLPDIQHLH